MNIDKLPVDRGTAQHLRLGADEITVLASCADTGGAMFVVEVRMPSGGGPPVMHRHEPAEVYYVTAGELTFYIGEPAGAVSRVTAVTGDVVPLSGGTPHTIRNESTSDAAAFVVHSPGGVMEGFASAVAAHSTAGETDIETVLRLAERHGIEMLGPVPSRFGDLSEPVTAVPDRWPAPLDAAGA